MKIIDNLKNKIRKSLYNFLKIEDLRIEYLVKFREKEKELMEIHKDLESKRRDIDILHNTIKNVVSVGADVVPNSATGERSWAVVCIEGNYNIVKFINMSGANYVEILNYLKGFEGSRMVIDANRPTCEYFLNSFKLK